MDEQCKNCVVYQMYARLFDIHVDRLDCPLVKDGCFTPYKKMEG